MVLAFGHREGMADTHVGGQLCGLRWLLGDTDISADPSSGYRIHEDKALEARRLLSTQREDSLASLTCRDKLFAIHLATSSGEAKP